MGKPWSYPPPRTAAMAQTFAANDFDTPKVTVHARNLTAHTQETKITVLSSK